jgi:hypothetical protein
MSVAVLPRFGVVLQLWQVNFFQASSLGVPPAWLGGAVDGGASW